VIAIVTAIALLAPFADEGCRNTRAILPPPPELIKGARRRK